MSMATQTVTVLFTDLVGSTELLSRLGEAAADELRREHYSRLRDAVADAGGHEVKSVGDGLMVVFGGVGAGLACAVAMQQSVAVRPASGEPVSMRVGLAVGEVEAEDGDYHGRPVIEAARLCARCEGGEILTTDMVRLLARSRGGFDLEPVGDLELKGLDEPVCAHRVRWEPLAGVDDALLPPPARVAALAASSYVGRLVEHECLDVALKEASAGDRRAVLVSGEPGIGKTTLAARFAVRASGAGAAVLYGRCDEDLHVPYQPWAQALGYLVEHAPLDLLRRHVKEYGIVLGRVVPAIWGRTVAQAVAGDPGSDESDRARFFAAVVDLLARASERAPLVVLLDDLQWADAGTLELLRHVLSADRRLSVLIISTFRDGDVGPNDPLSVTLAALHREQGVVRVHLRGLGDDELLAFMELMAGHEMDEEGIALRDALSAETDGNPFFVGELLRHLASTRAIYQDAQGRWLATVDLRTAGLPVSIREVVGQRVRSLGEVTHRLLTLAAVIGRDFDLELLERISGDDGGHVVDLCETAVAAQILRGRERGDGYAFAHALIERTLYDSFPAARRARAHRAIAEALEELSGGEPGSRVGELAYHWSQTARPRDAAKAVAYAARAGARALASLAPGEAVRWYTQALEFLESDATAGDGTRAELLVGLGDAQRQAGIPAYRETLLEAAWVADRADDVPLLARAALTNNRGWQSRIGDADEERLAVLQRALARVGDDAPATRARLLALSATEQIYTTTLERRLALAGEAIGLARASGDSGAVADALIRGVGAVIVPATLPQRRTWLTEAVHIADDLGDPALRFMSRHLLIRCELESVNRLAFDQQLAIAGKILEDLPDAGLRWTHTYDLAVQSLLAGDLDEAERLATEALNLGVETGQPDALTIYGAQLLNVRVRQGRLAELVPLIEDTVASLPGQPVYQSVLAKAYAEGGDLDRSRSLLESAHAAQFAIPDDNAWSSAHMCWADVALSTRHLEAAEVLHGRLVPFRDHLVTTHVTVDPVVSDAIGRLEHLLRRYDDADDSFRRAHRLHEDLGCPLLVALTEAAWAQLLTDRRRDGDHERARAMAERAQRTASDGGYRSIEAEAGVVLERLN
jgi:class 3 adenylate cyclase/tetratricopeptide (TPR) repeat protein